MPESIVGDTFPANVTRRYLDRNFPDGTPVGWSFELLDGGGARVRCPGNVEYDVSAEGNPSVGWQGLDRLGLTGRLWANSLVYLLHAVDTSSEVRSLACRIFGSYWRFLDELNGDWKLISLGSLDHQIGLQLRVLSYYGALESEDPMLPPGSELFDGLVDSLRAAVLSLDLLSSDNHGVMLAVGLLHANVVFGESMSVPGTSNARLLEFLDQTFARTSTEDGVVDENTPFYQKYWGDLAAQAADIISFLPRNELNAELIEKLLGMRDKYYSAFSAMLLPDGSIPPLGDSNQGRQSVVTISQPSILASEPNGLLIVRTDRTFFSLVCGYRGVIHKQLDDTSITLWHDGAWIVNDSGLINYDQTNPEAMEVRGQKGHSGAFYRELDGVFAHQVIRYSDATRLVKATMVVEQDAEVIRVVARSQRGHRRVTRTVTMNTSLTEIDVVDKFESHEPALPVSRFLLSNGTHIDIASPSRCLILGNGGKRMIEISAEDSDNGEPNSRVTIESAVSGTPAQRLIRLEIGAKAEVESQKVSTRIRL